MSSKLSIFSAAVAISICTFSFSAHAQKSAVTTSSPQPSKPVTAGEISKEVAEALSVIQKGYVGGSKLNYNDVTKSSIDSMLHTLDPHSNYFDAKEFQEFANDQSSRYFGIGATIGDLSDSKGDVLATYIKATFEDAPANRAGLRYGDKIISINGESMLGKPYIDVRNKLRGDKGTSAKLVVERLGTGKHEVVEIVRDAVPQPSIGEIYMIRPGIGYMAMHGGFNQTTAREFYIGMQQLKAQGMQQLIIDLRDNGGGLVNQAFNIANAFLAEGQTVFSQHGRLEGVSEDYEARNPTPDPSPILMIVNRNTASASEILAGALQDHDRAFIVGENTFGKGLVQQPFRLDYGSMLLLTIAKYKTPSGRTIQRDYSNGDLYNYYYEGGSFRDDDANRPKGLESKTDLGRPVYGGGGINPDVVIKPTTISIERSRNQVKMVNPVFAFSLDLIAGKVKGYEKMRIDSPIVFDHDLKPTDFAITDDLYQTFKRYAVANFKLTQAQIDAERKLVERLLRTELVTAAYGSNTSLRIYDEYDDQLNKAVELVPKAKQLAVDAIKASSSKQLTVQVQ